MSMRVSRIVIGLVAVSLLALAPAFPQSGPGPSGRPADADELRVFHNPGHENDWIDLKLVGVKTNRGALGARITITVESADGSRRTINRTVGSGGSFGASPLRQHIGLGRSAATVDVDVWWPTSNTRQHFADLAKNQTFQIEELASKATRLPPPSPVAMTSTP